MPWSPGCDCDDCTRQERAGQLLDRLDTVLAFLQEMSRTEDPRVRYSAEDLRRVLQVLDAGEGEA